MKRFVKFFMVASIFAFVFSCNHGSNNKDTEKGGGNGGGGGSTPVVEKELKVASILVHKQPIDPRTFEISLENKYTEVKTGDVEATFSLEGGKAVEIVPAVEGSSVTLKEGEFVDVKIMVPAKKGEYKKFEKTLKVKRLAQGQKVDPKPVLASLKVHGETITNLTSPEITLENDKTSVKSGNIEATFNYGSKTGESISVNVTNGDSLKEGENTLTLSIDAKPNEYAYWSIPLKVVRKAKEGNTPPPTGDDAVLNLDTIEIHGMPVANEAITLNVAKFPKIEAGNITAKFNYGSVSKEVIAVVVEGGTFVVEEGKTKDLKLSVAAQSGKHKGWNGTVKVTGTKVEVPNHLNAILLIGGEDKGKEYQVVVPTAEIKPILEGKVKELELLGPVARIFFISATNAWDSAEVNGKAIQLANGRIPQFKGLAAYGGLALEEKDCILKFKLTSGGKVSEGTLKLNRKPDLVDIPDVDLLIDDVEVKKGKTEAPADKSLHEALWLGGFEKTVATDKVKIQVGSLLPFVKEVVINGETITPTKKTLGSTNYELVAEKEISGITEAGVDITIKIVPIDNVSSFLRTVDWKFKVKKQ